MVRWNPLPKSIAESIGGGVALLVGIELTASEQCPGSKDVYTGHTRVFHGHCHRSGSLVRLIEFGRRMGLQVRAAM